MYIYIYIYICKVCVYIYTQIFINIIDYCCITHRKTDIQQYRYLSICVFYYISTIVRYQQSIGQQQKCQLYALIFYSLQHLLFNNLVAVMIHRRITILIMITAMMLFKDRSRVPGGFRNNGTWLAVAKTLSMTNDCLQQVLVQHRIFCLACFC